MKTHKPLRRKAWMKRGTKPLRAKTKLRPFGKAKVRRTKEYAAHLRSPYWKALRRVVFERDGYRCVDCGAKAGYFTNGKRDMRGLECDHVTYVRLFRELPEDCRTRCRPCHRLRHASEQWWKTPRLPRH